MLFRNLGARTGTISSEDRELIDSFAASSEVIAQHYDRLEYSRAMREICRLADVANKYLDDKSPWTTVKTDAEVTRTTLTAALEAFRLITIYIKPVMPHFAERVEKYLNIPPLSWSDVGSRIENHEIGKFEHLAVKISKEEIDKIVEESKIEVEAINAKKSPLELEPLAPECTIEDFLKADLRIARVEKAEYVEGSDQLLKMVVDIGGAQKTLFAGIKNAYKPEDLQGSLVVVVANLKPRKMRFGVSEAMVLASGEGGSNIFVLRPDNGAIPGQRVH